MSNALVTDHHIATGVREHIATYEANLATYEENMRAATLANQEATYAFWLNAYDREVIRLNATRSILAYAQEYAEAERNDRPTFLLAQKWLAEKLQGVEVIYPEIREVMDREYPGGWVAFWNLHNP